MYINLIKLLFLLPSSSIIVTVVRLGLLIVTSLGNEDESIKSAKFSLPSNVLSSFIGIVSKATVPPAVNVTLYGPEV